MAVPIDVRTEILINGTWTDITSYCLYSGDPNSGSPSAVITRGQADESPLTTASVLTLPLRNPDGRFTSRNPTGPYYPYLTQNTPIRVSVPEGSSYLRSEDSNASYASTPDSVALSVTGNIEIQVDLTLDNWNSDQALAAKWTAAGGQRSWLLTLNDNGTLAFRWSPDGTNSNSVVAVSTVPVPYPALNRQAVKVTMATATGTVQFFTAQPSVNQTPLGPITNAFAQLGATVVVGAAAIFDSTAIVTVGAAPGALADYPFWVGYLGKIHKLTVKNGIGGTTVASPDFTAQTAGTTSFADAQSNTWTLAGAPVISSRRFRFHGEVAAWPKTWDPTGSDVRVNITANGLLRRLGQSSKPIDSALKRYWARLTGSAAPVAYWPCEDMAGATQIASALPAGQSMGIAGKPSLASSSAFACSSPLPVMNGGSFRGAVLGYAGTDIAITVIVAVPLADDTDLGCVLSVWTTGTAARVDLMYDASAHGLEWIGFDQSGTPGIFASGTSPDLRGQLVAVRLGLQQSGGNVNYTSQYMRVLGATQALGSLSTGSYAGTTGAVRSVAVNSGARTTFLLTSAIGHVAIQSAFTDLSLLAQPLAAFAGEAAGIRFQRLCGEERLPLRAQGQLSITSAMGYQLPATLLSLLQDCVSADRGVMFEPRQALALGFRSRYSLSNQAAAVALDYAGAHLTDMQPTDDDQPTQNDVTVSRSGGSSSRQAQLTGPKSVQNPQAGVGTYDTAITLNVWTDNQAADEAGWLVHLGTVNEDRFPVLSLNLRRSEVASIFYDLQETDIGDFYSVANPPAWIAPDTIKQIVKQTIESLGGFLYLADWAGAPESPYETAVSDDAVLGRVDTDGSTLAANIGSGDATMSVLSSGMPWTVNASDLPFDILMGGERMTVTGITGKAPQVGAFLSPAAMGEPSFSQAVTDWQTWTGITLKVTRVYFALSSFPTVDATLTYCVSNGIKAVIQLKPAFNPTSATDRTNLAAMLVFWKAAGLDAEITLWAEPFFNGLSSGQFAAMIAFYGPTVRASYPLVFCTAAASVILNSENSYYTSDADFDKCATDFYASRWAQSMDLDLAATPADHAVPPKPFGWYEMNGSPAGGNFLTGDNWNFEGSIGTWTGAGNANVSQTSAQHNDGSFSLQISSVAAGDATAAHCAAANILTQGLPCSAGDPITASAFVRSAVSARSVAVGATFYTNAGVLISSLFGSSVTDSTSAWVNPTDSGAITAPATAAFCRLAVRILATGGAAEIHYADDCSIGNGNTGQSIGQIQQFFAWAGREMLGRVSQGKQNADIILFNSGGIGNYGTTTPIVSASDFRVALFIALHNLLNSLGSPQTFTVTRSVNGVVKSHTAGEALSLFNPPVLAM